MSCGVVHGCGLDPVLLWLWLWPAAAALTGPLSWEPPYAAHVALKRPKKKKKKKKKKLQFSGGLVVKDLALTVTSMAWVMGSVPGLGTSACHRYGPNKKISLLHV